MTKQIAVVTGGMCGIDEAVSVRSHDVGYAVVATNSPGIADASEWLARIELEGRQFRAYPIDVADFDSCEARVKQFSAEVGSIDILANNAGNTPNANVKKLDKAG